MSLLMRFTRLTSTILFFIGVITVTAGYSTVQTTQNTTSDTLALQQKEDSSSEYANSSPIRLVYSQLSASKMEDLEDTSPFR